MPTAATTGFTMQARLLDMFLYLGSQWVLYLLLVLSVISIAVAVERLVYFVTRRADHNGLQASLRAHLDKGDLDAARALLRASQSHMAAVALSGLEALGRGAEAAQEMMASAVQNERLKMERGLAFLGTLGNNAPFIGLFGTVLGIIRSFRDLATNIVEGSAAVMSGIAEALVATAVGLLVALPAVAIFNAFQRAIRKELAASDAIAHLVLAHAKTEKG